MPRLRRRLANFSRGHAERGIRGQVIFDDAAPDGVRVSIHISGLAPGSVHGLHVHTNPVENFASPDCCLEAGDHFNPTGSTHGSRSSPDEHHAGDLCNNVVADGNGIANFTYVDPDISIDTANPDCIIGRAVVLHELEDDCGLGGRYGLFYHEMPDDVVAALGLDPTLDLLAESKKTGNAGKRIACANIT